MQRGTISKDYTGNDEACDVCEAPIGEKVAIDTPEHLIEVCPACA